MSDDPTLPLQSHFDDNMDGICCTIRSWANYVGPGPVASLPVPDDFVFTPYEDVLDDFDATPETIDISDGIPEAVDPHDEITKPYSKD